MNKEKQLIKQIEALNINVMPPSNKCRTATYIFVDNIDGKTLISYKTGYVRGFSNKQIRQQYNKLYFDETERLKRILKYFTNKRNRK